MAAGRKKNRSPKKNPLGEYRLIAGEWRRRRLSFPEVEGLRPTTDRVRETVFSWLQPYLPGARVLDAFAGSGALGFEALSRGAVSLTALEKSALACRYLKENAELLGASMRLHQGDAVEWLQEAPASPYDLILLDPPFRKGLLQQVLPSIAERGWCAPRALVYLERGVDEPASTLPANWKVLREKQAGQVNYALLAVAGESE